MKKTILTAILSIILCLTFILTTSARISEGKDYSLVTPASAAYPDDGIKLTDGIYGTIPDGSNNYYSSGAYVGFNKENADSDGNFSLILDLGESYDGLTEFTVGYLNETDAGISAPKSVRFAISGERNGEYTDLGSIDTHIEFTSAGETHAKTLTVDAVSGRYVKVTITPEDYSASKGETTTTAWTFIDEIAVNTSSTSGDDSNSVDSSDDSDGLGDSDTSNGSGTITDNSEASQDTSLIPDNSADVSDDLGDTPQTGDTSSFLGFALLAVSALATLSVMLIPRFKKSKF